MEEEVELSLLDVWKLILKKKIIGSIVFGIVSILGLIIILYVYNPLKVTYEATFHYNWIGIENQKYANGDIFNYYDIISLENLEKVRNSNADYQNINVKKLADNIKLEIEEKEFYLLTASGRFFKNDVQAKAFLEDLIYLPYEKAINLNFDFQANLIGYERAKKMSSKIEYLQNQLNLILKGYQDLISYFGDIELDTTHLSGLYQNVEVFAANKDLKEYNYIAYQNYYLTKEEYQSIVEEQNALETEQKLLRERKQVLLDSLRNIYTNSNGNTYMDTSIANYLNSLHTLDTRLISIDETLRLIAGATAGKYNEEESQLFLELLDEYKEELESLSSEYSYSVTNVLKENTFVNLNPIQETGKMNLILSVCLSILIGIICGLGVAFLVAFMDKNKNEKN